MANLIGLILATASDRKALTKSPCSAMLLGANIVTGGSMSVIKSIVAERVRLIRSDCLKSAGLPYLAAIGGGYMLLELANRTVIQPSPAGAITFTAAIIFISASAHVASRLAFAERELASAWLLGHLKLLNAAAPDMVNASAMAEIASKVGAGDRLTIADAVRIESKWLDTSRGESSDGHH